MKKLLLIVAFLSCGVFAQAQLRFGFTNPIDYDNWNNNDTNAGVELVVWTPNNDTLKLQVGCDVSAIDGSARNGFEYNFPPVKCMFEPGTNIFDSSNRKVFKYKFTPNTTLFGKRDFYIVLTGFVGVTKSNLMYSREIMRVIIDYDGTNVGVKQISREDFRLFPVPANTRLFIEGVNPKTYKIYDLSGKVVAEGDVDQNSIDIEGLNNGLYVLHAQTEKGMIVQKFLKD